MLSTARTSSNPNQRPCRAPLMEGFLKPERGAVLRKPSTSTKVGFTQARSTLKTCQACASRPGIHLNPSGDHIPVGDVALLNLGEPHG